MYFKEDTKESFYWETNSKTADLKKWFIDPLIFISIQNK